MIHFQKSPVALSITCWLTGLACGAVATTAQAQNASANAQDRLSVRLMNNLETVSDHSLMWVADPSMRLEQQLLKNRILEKLALHAHQTETRPLADFIAALPVTGRLANVADDLAELMVTPAVDYALNSNSTVTRQTLKAHVAVLGGDGQVCSIHLPSSTSIELLLEHCLFSGASASDEAWVIQADGSTHRMYTNSWNRYAQTLVAPGAWVWRPPRALQSDLALNTDIARFLSTQALPPPTESALPSLKAESAKLLNPTGWQPLLSANDWGETGLLQTPSARTSGLGNLRLNLSRAYPYTRANVFLQPTNWLEFGFRYTDIATALYGPNIAGDQTYKDKSFDFKTVLSQEDAYWPQIALGMRDIGGTGLFSSEYIVASKRFESLDWSLGIGWGNMAGGSTLANPLGALFPSLKQRKVESSGQGGTISTNSMFAGNAALFGGVQWTLPSGQHVLKLEVEGNRYTQEPFGQNLNTGSQFNVGWLYRLSPGIDLSLALERGNKLAFAVTFSDNLRTLTSPKPLDPPALNAAQLVPARTNPIAITTITAPPTSLFKQLQELIQTQTGWHLLAMKKAGGHWQLALETDDAVYASERLERLFDILCANLPNDGKTVDIELRNYGLRLRRVSMSREAWLAQRVYPELPALQLNAMEWERPGGLLTASSDDSSSPETAGATLPSRLETGWGPVASPILGGPNSFVLYQAGLRAFAQYRLDDNTWAFGQTNFRLADNYSTFVYDAPSKLPRVRTDQRQYVTTSRTTVPVAQLTRTVDIGNGHYASAYGGLLEPMYAGVGAEWLWRPWNASWAMGVDVNEVKQRAYEQDLGLRDYRTTTGHATLYWNTGFNGVVAKVSAGKYLAKDVGATLDVSRTFANGTSIGAWATKTNVSAEQYGEGSFDKGIYINIPFDAVLPRSTPSMATLSWSPLSRDGGAKLSRQFPLYELTRHADLFSWRYRSANSERARQEVLDESPSLLGALFPQRTGPTNLGASLNLGDAIANAGVNSKALALGAGAILLTMAVDQSVADRLGAAPGPAPSSTSKALSNVPYLLAAGVGAGAVGAWGEDARTTAYASISATAWALGTNLVGKSLIGRARPNEGQGAWEFRGPNSDSPQSSFASNHVTAAMALATPFAQRYEQPWLYGLAALTAMGRIQANEHWASDTVGGALIGYAFGTLALENQHEKRSRWAFNASLNHVEASLHY